MWIWLTISMLLVIACIVFGIYSFISSRTLQKSISSEPGYNSNDIKSILVRNHLPVIQKQPGLKIKFIEENSLLNTHHLSELKKRIEALESGGGFKAVNEEEKWDDSKEDWEKLYYDTKREKQSFEDNLNKVKATLQENMKQLQELEKKQAVMKSDVDFGINEIHSLQDIIEEFKRKVEGGMEREKEMAEELAYEKLQCNHYELIQKENNQLQSERDMLTNRIGEINERNILMEEKIKRLTDLGSILEISEYEKMGIKNSVEQLLQKI